MSLTRQLTHNTLIQTIGKFFSIFLGVIGLSIMTRYLGTDGFGQYTIIVAFLQFFAIMADMGLMLITVQMLSEPNANEQKILSNIFTLRIFTSLAFLSLAPLVVLFFPYSSTIKIGISIFTFSFFLLSLIQVLTGLFQKRLKIIEVTVADILGKATMIIFILIAVYLDLGLFGVMIAGIIGNIFNVIYLLFATSKLLTIKLSFDFDVWKTIFTKSWPIAVSIAFNLVYLKTDTIILSLYHSQSDVGIYGASFRFLEILIMIPTMFMGLVLPILSNYWAQKNMVEFKKMLQTAFNVMVIAAIPMVAGTWILAEKIIVLISGKDFASAAPVLKIIVLASAIVFIGTLYGHTIVAINKQKKMIWAYALTAVTSLIAYFVFIPKFSYFGAAWATVFAESLIAIICFAMVVKTTKTWPDIKIIFKSLVASGAMLVVLYYVKNYSIVISIPLAIITYVSVLYSVKGFSKEFVKEITTIK